MDSRSTTVAPEFARTWMPRAATRLLHDPEVGPSQLLVADAYGISA